MDRDLTLILFDVDGTLVDSIAQIVAAMEAAFAAEDLPPPARDAIQSIVGLSLPDVMARLAPEHPLETRNRLVEAYKDSYAAGRARELSPLYPGAAEALQRLSEVPEILLGIATGKSRRGLTHVLAGHGLAEHFVTRQVADDHPSKPHPSMVLTALSETGVGAGRCVLVGDTVYDMEMARAAGVGAIGVNWGYHPPSALVEAGGGPVAESFQTLADRLLAFHGGR